jgi:hypothetical protein
MSLFYFGPYDIGSGSAIAFMIIDEINSFDKEGKTRCMVFTVKF